MSECILNDTSAQLGYTVPLTLVHAGIYRTEDKLKIQTIQQLNTTQKSEQHKTILPWFSHLLRHLARKRGELIQCSQALMGYQVFHYLLLILINSLSLLRYNYCCKLLCGSQITFAVAGRHSFFRAVRSWSLRLSALMDSDLAWVNGKSTR